MVERMRVGTGWRGGLPILAMALVVVLLGVLLWLLHHNQAEERAETLIQDVLWVEQDLHFHLTTNAESLTRLANRLGREGLTSELFYAESSTLISSSPDLRRIILRDAGEKVLRAAPPADPLPETEIAPDWHTGFVLARSLGQPVYGAPFWLGGESGVAFDVYVPVFHQGQFVGMLIATVSLDEMLSQQVPWWFAQKYRLEIVDGDGMVLATKSQLEVAEPGLSHQVRFEPPGKGLAIVVTAYRQENDLVRNLLAASIFGLALTAFLSLWALRRHMRRRLEAEQALRAEHAFRKAMEESLTVGMRARDLDGRVTYVNSAFCRMVGWDAADLIGSVPPMVYWAPEETESCYSMFRAVLRGDAPPEGFELTLCRKTGERFKALVYEAPLIDSEGRHSGWMASILDITERERVEDLSRQQQEKLQRTARLITMGEMASTLAHELNQPLSAIASYAAGCLNRLEAGNVRAEELEAPLTKLGIQAQRAGQIIRRIHDFVRKSKPSVAPCAINRVIEGAVGFVDADARKHGIRVTVTPDPTEPWVDADRILIEQVVLNLARNAVEAMSATPWFHREIDISIRTAEGQAVVRVSDRGTGITPEMADGLFTPFFSTKEEGMGMGLNICRSIVEWHRGRLWYEPNPGGGSVFLFTLPTKEV